MQYITLKFKNNDAKRITNLLRRRYRAGKRTGLRSLCKIAVRSEVAAQVEEELGGKT